MDNSSVLPAGRPGIAPAAVPAAPARERPARADVAGRIIVAAVAIGVVGDVLLRGGGPGINVTLVVSLCLAALVALAARAGRLGPQALALVAAAALFAAAFALRASPALFVLNAFSLGTALAALAATLASRGRWSVRGARFRDYFGAAVFTAVQMLVGAPFAAAEAARGGALGPRWLSGGGDVRVAVRAVVLTAPLLILFAGLLTAADPAFAQLLGNVFEFDMETVFGHVLLASLIAWPAAGYARGALLSRLGWRGGARALLPRLGIAEVAVALGSLNVLFLAFVAVQLRYLFGGHAGMRVAGMSYAEYARRGFFELVWVVALVLPVLLVARQLLGRVPPRAERTYRALGATMLVLVLMIVGSAMQRMWMYQLEFGLTELRLYTSVFMGWIVAVLGLFALTVLQGRTRGLAFGALSSGWAAVAALNLANPDALIVRVNAARVQQGRSFDAAYATRLSDDAVPTLAAHAVSATGDARCAVAWRLARATRPDERADWRSWNLGRARAMRVDARGLLAAAAAECGPVGDPAAWATWAEQRRRARTAPPAPPVETPDPSATER